jgi:2-polyprenyl-3-methyl-5-hydroxy-6-metoxy-1,4-benzoquinol methylase
MLTLRSYKKELLDSDNIPFEDIRQNMKELDFINRWLGGHAITVDGFTQLAGEKKEISVCEIGCGGGDNLLAIYKCSRKHNIHLSVTGIDIKTECIEYATSRRGFPSPVKWITSDYSVVKFDKKPDIIFSSLFCHHFTEEELVFQLNWMKENSVLGFFINDLQRNVLAYYSIKLLTQLFSKSYLVKNDAPVSVTRGFRRQELETVCKKAKVAGAAIFWKWAFRYLLIFKHGR